MIRSMTGYGRAQKLCDGREITVEIRSVNHRYFEFSSRIPRVYGYLDEKLKNYIQPFAVRGKVDVNVSVITLEGKDAQVEINHTLAKEYLDALRALSEDIGVRDDIALSNMTQFSNIFLVRKETEDEEVIWNSVKEVCDEAVEKFIEMKEIEGQRLLSDIQQRLDNILEQVARVEVSSPIRVEQYRERLYGKIKEVLENTAIDEQRILTEAAIFADKVAVDEETVRLRSHLKQFSSVLSQSGQIGRKLDFLVQEINRETNTIGSKSNDIEITQIVVDIKSEIEKIREQIQNIE